MCKGLSFLAFISHEQKHLYLQADLTFLLFSKKKSNFIPGRRKGNNPSTLTWNNFSFSLIVTFISTHIWPCFPFAWPHCPSLLFPSCLFNQLWTAHLEVALHRKEILFWLNIERQDDQAYIQTREARVSGNLSNKEWSQGRDPFQKSDRDIYKTVWRL